MATFLCTHRFKAESCCTLSSKLEVYKSVVDHKMVATPGIFIGDQRIASWGTQPFGDHQEYSCSASPSLPSPPFLPCHHSLLTLHAEFLLPDRLCSNRFLFGIGFGFEMLRGQKTGMSKHLGLCFLIQQNFTIPF